MPDDKSKLPEVNLLPGDDFGDRPGGQFLHWALTWGKRIVVTTELVVILAFLSRFWLDTEVANNSEKIDQKKLVVLSQKDFEEKFRALSDRVSKAKSIEMLVSPLTVYAQTEELVPLTVTVSQLSATNHSVSFSATSDEASLGKLVEAFKSSPKFSDVSVEKVAAGERSGIVDFSLSASFVGQNLP